jgi:hypothetical protein
MMQGQVNTNLGEPELLSLLARGLSSTNNVEWRKLPLAPVGPQGSGGLREVAKGAPEPIWPAAEPGSAGEP